ncbi:MAG: hypothetical protein ABIQ44_12205 [Chloroflexia bacterium]
MSSPVSALATTSALIRSVAIGLCILVLSAPQRAFADVKTGANCTSDSKFLNGGPTQVFGDAPGTYWNLEEGGLQSAFGNDEAAKIQYLSGVFGQQFTTLEAARDYNLQALSATFDKNQDGLVCVYDLRGTRASFRDPYSKYTYFSVSDDKVSKKSTEALRFRSVPGS